MPVYRPRTRTISFRLSENEYAELRTMSIAHGSRSLSDFARWTVRRSLGANPLGSHGVEAHVRELRDKTEQIDRELGRLMRLMDPPALEE